MWAAIGAALAQAATKSAGPGQAAPMMPQYHNAFSTGDWNVATSGSKLNAGQPWYVLAIGGVVVIYAVKRFTRK
jgi:hypothetical protein